MALRSGYYGLKNTIKKKLEKLAVDTAGMKIIKTIGDGLNLTTAGKLNVTEATDSKLGGVKVGDSLSILNGVLNVLKPLKDLSSSEVNTGLKWYDGNDIYMKTIDCGLLTNATGETAKDVNHLITGFNKYVFGLGSWNDTVDNSIVGGSVPMTNNGLSISIQADDTKIQLWYRGDFSTFNVIVTLFYTKESEV